MCVRKQRASMLVLVPLLVHARSYAPAAGYTEASSASCTVRILRRTGAAVQCWPRGRHDGVPASQRLLAIRAGIGATELSNAHLR